MHGRRVTKDNSEPWSSVRPKSSGPDEAERIFRRNGDREQDRENDGGREIRTPQVRGFENHRRGWDRDRDSDGLARRTGPGRGRNEPSWYKEDDHTEEDILGDNRDSTRNRDWRDKDRDGDRGADRGWTKGAKTERDPEWMDGPETEDKQAHTQEDFERWKERMRASKAPAQDSPPLVAEQHLTHDRTTSSVSTDITTRKVETPLIVDAGFDGFFGMWNEPRKGNDNQGIEEMPKKEVARSNAPKPSRFTGFFNPPSEAKPAAVETPVPAAKPSSRDSSSEDKEGFQRILQMLGGNLESGTSEPNMMLTGQVNPARVEQQHSFSASDGLSFQEQRPINAGVSPPTRPSRSRKPTGLESLLGAQPPRDGPTPPSRDSEFLLKLMQQTRPVPQHVNSSGRGAPTPGLLPFSNLMISPRDTPQQNADTGPPSNFYNGTMKEETLPRDKLNPNATGHRMSLTGPPPGLSESHRQPPLGAVHNPGLLPRLQRPPGLEQMPPGYAQHVQSQRQSMIAPPPGFQSPMRNPYQMPPGLMPNPNLPNERGLVYGGMRPILQNNGSSGMPPPGFIGMNAPPPTGYPPLQLNQDGGSDGRVFYGGSAGPQQRPPPMDLFAEAGNFGIGGQGGGGGPPGVYRRQE